MPDAAFTFTGQVRPVCELGLSDVRQPEPDEWLDVSCYVHEAELFRGRDRFTDRFQPGTATVTFKNTDGWADLVGSPSVVATQTLRPGRPIRVGVTGTWQAGVGVRWLWRGWVDQTTPQYHPVEHDVVVVNCVDALGEAGSAPAPASFYQGVNEGAGARIHRVLDAVEWFTAKRKIDNSFTAVQGTSMGALAIDMMGQAADSAGGVVHGDLDGDVVFRDINWMLYDPDIPPDGIIGNVDPGTPGIDYIPGYLDPTLGYVYWPAPPPLVGPTTVKVCADAGDGTLVEQGDGYELFVEGGHLMFRSGGRVWDMGPYDGGCTGATFDPDGGGDPVRIDDPDGDGEYDIGLPGVELDPLVLEVELVGWSQGCVGDDVTEGAVDIPISAPGVDCLLVAMAIAQPSVDNAGHYLLQGAAEGASFPPTGGGVDWTVIHEADASVNPSLATWIHACELRADAGSFSVHYDWISTHTSRIHAAVVYRIKNANRDWIDRLFGGLVGGGETAAAHDWIRGTPGDGARTLTVAAADTDLTAIDAAHVTVVLSLADESVGPYGATYDTSDGTWTFPLETTITSFVDEFDRADGSLGVNWVTPDDGYFFAHDLAIVDEAAVAPEDVDTPTGDDAGLARSVNELGNDQFVEIEVTQAAYDFQQFYYLEVYRSHEDGSALMLYMEVYAGGTGNNWRMQRLDADGSSVETFADDGGAGFAFTYPGVIRLEILAGTLTATVNGTELASVAVTTPPDGRHVTFGSSWSGAFVNRPRIERVSIGGAGAERCVSWETAWRTAATSPTVSISDINLGDEDVQSAAMALVVEGPVDAFNLDDDGALAVGGQSNAYSGFIYSAGAWQGVDPNDPDAIPIWTFDPGAPLDLGDL